MAPGTIETARDGKTLGQICDRLKDPARGKNIGEIVERMAHEASRAGAGTRKGQGCPARGTSSANSSADGRPFRRLDLKRLAFNQGHGKRPGLAADTLVKQPGAARACDAAAARLPLRP
ncbi:hypothetical protein MesoLjLc_25310 [Mesorhizobium sp. L-8-10]|nr:hypothetical protein MesoLjLc_25310 [Mesorhizobium sp. L-8-10]